MAGKSKEIIAKVKLQLPGGRATPAPPVGPALGQHGVKIGEFCNEFNKKTEGKNDMIIPVVATIYSDRSFTFVTKSPPASALLKKAVGVAKASGIPNREKIGKVSRDEVRKIARLKADDLNAASEEAAVKIIEGTARSMGVEIESNKV